MTNRDSRFYRIAAAAALENAEALLDDAAALLAQERPARAMSLSILGAEEVGKAVIYALASAELVSGLKERLAVVHNNPVRDHALKQVMAEVADVAGWLVDDYLEALADGAGEYGYIDDREWLTSFLDACAPTVSDALARRRIRDLGKDWYRGIRNSLRGWPVSFGQGFETAEEKKWRGFYVDPERPGQPSDVTTREATGHVEHLRIVLHLIQRLRAALATDASWAGAVQRIPNPHSPGGA